MSDQKISQLTNYTPPLDADVLPIVDTANTTTKKVTWANIKATLKTYFDTLYPSGSGTSTGTNTGDQTTVSGNAGTATALQNARTIGTITGDGTSAGSSFDGTANNTNALTLATVNSNVGSFTNANITVNAKGLVTAAANGTSGSSLTIFQYAGLGVAPTGGWETQASIPCAKFTNNQDQVWYVSTVVPTGATSISSIKIFYSRESTGNLYLYFHTFQNALASVAAQTDDTTDTATTYAGSGTDNRVDAVTVPSAAYNAITITAGALFTIAIFRNGANANDTYEQTWHAAGVQFNFA